jgi:hypothetical protein
MIITKNLYLKIALGKLVNPSMVERDLCIVDTDSFASIYLMLESLEGLDDTYQVLLIGRDVGYFSLLSEFSRVHDKTPVKALRDHVLSAKPMTIGMLRRQLKLLRSLSLLTKNEIEVCALCCRYDIHAISRIMNKKVKAIHQIVNIAMRKMKYKSMTHLLYFIINEFGLRGVSDMAGLDDLIYDKNLVKLNSGNRFIVNEGY